MEKKYYVLKLYNGIKPIVAKENGLVPLEDSHIVTAQPLVILSLHEYRALNGMHI